MYEVHILLEFNITKENDKMETPFSILCQIKFFLLPVLCLYLSQEKR